MSATQPFRSLDDGAAAGTVKPGTQRVLVLTGDHAVCLKLKSLLAKANIKAASLDWKSDYPSALSALRSAAYSVCFLSGDFSDGRGRMVLKELVSADGSPPIVYLPAAAEKCNSEELLELGAFDCIALDTASHELISRVLRFLGERASYHRTVQRHLAFEKLITTISTRFIKLLPDEMDAAVLDALELSGRFVDIDRAYLMLIGEDRQSVSMTHEWCREGIESAAAFYSSKPITPHRWLYSRLARGDVVSIEPPDELPDDAKAFREIMRARGIQSLVLAPLLYGGTLIGILGFSTMLHRRDWSEETISLLSVVAEVLVNAVQRQRTEETIIETEARFRTLVESLGEGILLCDPRDTILHVNSRMAELTGYTPEEMIGQAVYNLLLPQQESHKIRERTLRRLQGISESYAIKLQRKDGSRFWAEINAAPIRNSDGLIVGSVGAVTDISDRRLALEALQASEKKYRDLVETSSDLIWSVDGEGRWTFVNQAAVRIFGYEPAEMLGRKFTEFQTPEQAALDLKVFERLLAGTPVFQYVTQHLRKDGTPIHLCFNAIVLRDSEGNVTGTTGTASDITAKTGAETALRKSEERFKRFFDMPLIGMAVSGPHRHWIEVNDKLCQMFGYTRDELLTRSWVDLTHPDDLPANRAIIDRCERGEIDNYKYDKRFIRRDGSIMHVTTSGGCVRKPDGTIDYFLALHQDITERKRAEETSMRLQKQLLQSQKMEAIGKLAAGIAHDLNNALAAVVGHLQLLKMTAHQDETQQHSVDIALSGCKRASSLIAQLLGFSRQGKYNLSVCSLRSAVQDTLDFLQKVLANNIKIVLPAGGEDIYIRCDLAQIQQALTNLIINSQQAMPSGGLLSFEFGTERRLHPEQLNPSSRSGTFAFVRVTDTGVGIPEDHIDKLFEPFFTTKESGEGTGLGLSTVYGIMHSHGGWIEVDSVVGEGTTFSLYLPRFEGDIQKGQISHRKEITAPTNGIGGRILVIDDEKPLVDLGMEFLRRAGYSAHGFDRASAAIEWYREHYREVDMIVLDMKMPEMDGEACFEALRAVDPYAQVVILSGYSQDAAAQNLLRFGALKFFQKPLRYPDLVQWIGAELQRKRAMVQ